MYVGSERRGSRSFRATTFDFHQRAYNNNTLLSQPLNAFQLFNHTAAQLPQLRLCISYYHTFIMFSRRVRNSGYEEFSSSSSSDSGSTTASPALEQQQEDTAAMPPTAPPLLNSVYEPLHPPPGLSLITLYANAFSQSRPRRPSLQFGEHVNMQPATDLFVHPGPSLPPLDRSPPIRQHQGEDTDEEDEEEDEAEEDEMMEASFDFDDACSAALDDQYSDEDDDSTSSSTGSSTNSHHSLPSDPRPPKEGTSPLNPYRTNPTRSREVRRRELRLYSDLLIRKTEVLAKFHNLPQRSYQLDGSLKLSIGWFRQELSEHFYNPGQGGPVLTKDTWLWRDKDNLGLVDGFVEWLAGDMRGVVFEVEGGSVFR